MSLPFRTTALVLIITANPALAEITPEDAWDIWNAQAQALGLSIEATPRRDGDTLVIDSARLVAPFPDRDAQLFLDLGRVSFAPDGNGAVDIVLPETGVMVMGGAGDGETAELRINYSLTGLSAHMSGDPGNVITNWRYMGLEMTLGEFLVDGKLQDGFSGTLTAAPFIGRVATNVGEDQVNITASSTYVGMQYGYVIAPADQPGDQTSASGTISEYVGNVSFDLPRMGIDLMNLPAQLRNGLAILANFTLADMQTTQKLVAGGSLMMDQASAVQDQTFNFGLSKDGLIYSVASGLFSVTNNTPGLLPPIEVGISGISADFAMPILTASTPQQALLRLSLRDVTVNDDLLAMIDPDARLPRDPAYLTVDISGTLTPLVDLVDFPMLNKEISKGGEPLQVNTVTANTLYLSVFGASAQASGAFTIDNADRDSFDGLPAPEGTLEVKVQGANKLIDLLIDIGLISDNDATGIRVILGMFGRVGEGEDTVLSTIEVNPDGTIIANGQRMK